MTTPDTQTLLPCPFCGEKLTITDSDIAVHNSQSNGGCALSTMGIPVDHKSSVEKWNTRADDVAMPDTTWLDAILESRARWEILAKEAVASVKRLAEENDALLTEKHADAEAIGAVRAERDAAWVSEWQWWAGVDDEWATVGPCATRDGVIAEMVHDGCGEYLDEDQDPPAWMNAFYVFEARQDPLRLADWIGVNHMLENAEDALSNSDRVSFENENGPWFEVTSDQNEDLKNRLRRACDEWQIAHGLEFHSPTFSHSRNQEAVVKPALREIDEGTQ